MNRRLISIPSLVFALFLALGLLVYWQGVADYWLYDDVPNLVNNVSLELDGSELDDWRTAALSSGSGPLRRPLAMLSFAAERVIVGELLAPAIKFTNVVIHFAIAMLMYGFFQCLLKAVYADTYRGDLRWLALAAAAAWALHPLQVSTVLYPVQRMAQLSAFFVVLGLWLFSAYRSRWAAEGAEPGELAATACWLFLVTVCAGFSKENGLLLLWLIVALECVVFRGRWRGRTLAPLKMLAVAALVFPALLIVGLALAAPEWLVAKYSYRDFDLAERVQTQLRILWIYLRWLLLPDVTQYGLHHDDIPWSNSLLQPWTTLGALLAWLGLLFFAIWRRKQYPFLLLAVVFFLVGHSMESTVWPLLMVFEHRNYLPSIGVFLGLAVGLARLLHHRAGERAVALVVLLPLLLIPLLVLRVNTWSDLMLVGEAGVRNHSQSARSHYVYANSQLRFAESGVPRTESVDALTRARYHFERAVELKPDDLGVLVTLHQLDSTYFVSLSQRADWLGRIESILEEKTLTREEAAAIGNLMACLGRGGCAGGPAAYTQIAALLERRYPNWGQRYLLLRRYALASGQSARERLAIVQPGIQQHPSHMGLLLAALADASEAGDLGLVYSLALQVYQADPQRYQLFRMTALFGSESGP